MVMAFTEEVIMCPVLHIVAIALVEQVIEWHVRNSVLPK